MKKISVCLPTYNEERNVEKMYDVLTEIMSKVDNYEYEIVFGDNASTDSTQEILKKIAKKDKKVKVILNNKNFGPMANSAYILYQVNSDAIIGLPCDFQEPPEIIPELIRQWELGYKVVMGRKTSSDESKLMYRVRSLYYKIINMFSDVDHFEQVTGFGMFDIEVIKMIESVNVPDANFRNLVAEFGYSTKLIDYHQNKRENGNSGYSFMQYLNLAIETFVDTSNKAIRLITLLGVLFSVISFFCFLLILVLFFNGIESINITTILVSIACCIMSFLLFSTGLLGEYVYTILRIVNKKPLVTEKERINF